MSHNFVVKSRHEWMCYSIWQIIWIYQNLSKTVMQYVHIIILVSGVVIVYAKIQFIIPIMPHLIIDKHRMQTSSRWIFAFSKAHEIRNFNHTIREALLKLPVHNLNKTSNLLSLYDEQKKRTFFARKNKNKNSVFTHFCFSSHLISFHFNCNVPTFYFVNFRWKKNSLHCVCTYARNCCDSYLRGSLLLIASNFTFFNFTT